MGNFMKVSPVGAKLIIPDRWMARRDEAEGGFHDYMQTCLTIFENDQQDAHFFSLIYSS